MPVNVGDRSKVIFEVNNVKENTICTVDSIIDEGMAIIRYSHDDNDEILAYAPVSYLKAATSSEIEIDYKNLVHPNLWIGKKWRLYQPGKKDRIFEIVDVKPALNEKYDEIFLKDVDGGSIISMDAVAVLDTLFIYNAEIEDHLLEDKNRHERKIEIRAGLRVKVDNRIGVITHVDENNFKVKVRFIKDEKEEYIECNFSNIVNVTAEELKNINYRDVVERSLRLDFKYAATSIVEHLKEFEDFVKPKDKVIIYEVVSIDEYVLKDVFVVRNKLGMEMKLTTYDLLSYFKPA